MEDRLDELLARGVPREEAVRRALAEFGDAAGLAAQFVSLSWNRRRRWLMRVTTFSVAATVLIAAGIATFWPGRNAGPGLAEAVAQAPGVPGLPGPGGLVPAPAAAAEKPLEAKLNERIDVEFVETPLKDTLQYLRDHCQVQFVFRMKALTDAGVSADQPVTLQLKQVRLNTLLELMLSDLGLVHTEKDDLLIITTPDDAESTLEIRVYDCRDLLAMPEPGQPLTMLPELRPDGVLELPHLGPTFTPPAPASRNLPAIVPSIEPPTSPRPAPLPPATIPPAAPRVPPPPARPGPVPGAAPEFPRTVLPQVAIPDGGQVRLGGFGGGGGGMAAPEAPPKPPSEHELRAERLIDLITTNVDPENWSDVGGTGSISEYHGLIVVTQTAQTHKKVEHVLNMLRQAAGLESPQGRVVK